jgi:hypothetical protein
MKYATPKLTRCRWLCHPDQCGLLYISLTGVAALADVAPTDRLKSKLYKSSCIVPTVALRRASSLNPWTKAHSHHDVPRRLSAKCLFEAAALRKSIPGKDSICLTALVWYCIWE